MADIQGVITLGTGPTTGADIEHFILLGLNANPLAVTGVANQFYAYLSMDSSFSAPLAMDSTFRIDVAMVASYFVHVSME